MGQLSFQNLKMKTAVHWSVSYIGLIVGYVLQSSPSCKAFKTSHSISANSMTLTDTGERTSCVTHINVLLGG